MTNSIKRQADRVRKRLIDMSEKAIRQAAIQVVDNATNMTRVDTGRLRGNWQVTLNIPAINQLDTTGSNMSAVRSNIGSYTVRDVMYVSNNLAYAAVWELEDAMLLTSIGMWNQLLTAAVARQRGGV
jgi:hypothetical protein